MTLVVAEDDVIIRTLQVILDPDTDPERVAAIADYYSVDVKDFDAMLAEIRGKIPNLFPATVRMVGDQDAFRAALAEADAAVVESLTVDEDELAAAPRLAIVHKFGTDTRNIDHAACERHGVAVKTLHRRVNVTVAEHAFALMLALAKRICLTHGRLDIASLEAVGFPARMYDRRHVAGANWSRVDGLRTLAGATFGAVGLGEIGRDVAARAHAFAMEVLYYQRNRLPEAVEAPLGARYVSFDELLASSDFVSIHLPLDDTTRGMFDAATFAKMKPGAMLVNISRADIIDRDDLMAALDSGQLGGAGLDVHYKEPGEADDPLKRFANVVLTPHIGVGSRVNGALDMEELLGNIAEAVR